VPTCPRCKVAFLDGETHVCQRKSRRGLVVCSGVAVAYAVAAYKAGTLFQPAVIATYLFVVLFVAAGHLIANLFHLFGGG